MADLRPGFADKARDVVELILVAVYASAALAEMAIGAHPGTPLSTNSAGALAEFQDLGGAFESLTLILQSPRKILSI
jgi:hypothetical protein